MSFLFNVHSIVRWLVVIAAVVAIIVCAMTWLGSGKEGQGDRKAVSAFTGLMDLQFLLGLILLFGLGWSINGQMVPYRLEHATTMFLAVVVAHMTAIWKKKVSSVRARNSLFMIILALILIAAGISRLPQGWGIR